MSESNLYQQLKRNWPHYIRRIEPKDLNCGIPDCHLVNDAKRDLFVELKYLEKEFNCRQLTIKKSQFIWHSTYPGDYGFMLFKVSNVFYLFRSYKVENLKGKVNFEYFKNNCLTHSKDISLIIDIFKKSI